MIRVALRILLTHKSRFLITTVGVGFSLMLSFFISGVYEGVKGGATTYVRLSEAQMWICQKSTSNLIRSSSMLHTSILDSIRVLTGVREAEGLSRLIVNAQIAQRNVTLLLLGFEPTGSLGKPHVWSGTAEIGAGELILDESVMLKHARRIGDTVWIQDRAFCIRGVTRGTNTVAAQFGFISRQDAEALLGVADVMSYVLVRHTDAISDSALRHDVVQRFPQLSAWSKTAFLNNNLDELNNGILPILWAVVVVSIISTIAISASLLFSTVLEQREDYAVMKAIGSEQSQLVALVLEQSFIISCAGLCSALMLYFAASPLLTHLVPEITLENNLRSIGILSCAALISSVCASVIPILKLRSIYPTEVFRA